MIDTESSILRTDLQDHLPLIASGKVREIYELDHSTLLFVTTDRISAYDVVMKNGIPQKGALLTYISCAWFNLLQSLIPTLRTHFVSHSIPIAIQQKLPSPLLLQLEHRCMQVHRLKVFPIEAIVRGYITGSAWKEYVEKGTVHGVLVSGPDGGKLVESEKFEKPLYTPSTKAEAGYKDENIHPDRAAELIGLKYAKRIEELSLELYIKASEHALSTAGIIIADTKFEFGLDDSTDEVVLIDEVLTPDSSRFWSAASYRPGISQESYDKQHLRDWLTSSELKGKEGVELPFEVVRRTKEKYVEIFEKLMGRSWDETMASR